MLPRALASLALLLLGHPTMAAAQEPAPQEPPRPEGAAPVSVPSGPRLVLVPFENVPRASAARPAVMRAVEEALTAAGYQVVAGEPVEAFLRARRIRYLDSLTARQALELMHALDAEALMLGTILAWDASGLDPAVALTLRLLDPLGELRWSDLGGLTTAQSEGAFGRGRLKDPEALARRLVERLLAPLLQVPLDELRQVKPVARGGPRVYRSRSMPPGPLRVGVLPLENLTDARDAARLLDAVLQQRLSELPGLAPVSPAELRAAIVKARLRPPAQMSPEQLRKLGEAIGTSLFLRGVILGYGPAEDELGATPAVEVYLTLVDVVTGQTLWSALHRRTGLDYEGLFRLGAERSAVALAGRVVGEMLQEVTRP